MLQARLAAARSGVSVHYMTPALDSGAILAKRSVASPESASVFTATAVLFREGAELLIGMIDQVARGQAGSPQNEPGSYQSWPSRADIRALHTRGGALLRLADLRAIFSA